MNREQFFAALIGSLLGLLPIIFTTLISQMEKRSRASHGDKAIDLAQRRVAFLSAWFQARQQFASEQTVAEIKEKIALELDGIKSFVDDELALPQMAPVVKTARRNFFQRMFLLYQPQSAGGWIYHTLFYMFSSFVILFTLAQISFGGELVGYFSATFLFAILPALLFNGLANRLDRKIVQRMLANSEKNLMA